MIERSDDYFLWCMVVAVSTAFGMIAGCGRHERIPQPIVVTPAVGEASERPVRVVLLDPPMAQNENAPPFTRIQRRVRLRNDHDMPVELKILAKSNACIQYELAPSVVEPGSIATVVITVSTYTDALGGGSVTIGEREAFAEHSLVDVEDQESSWAVVGTVGLSFTSDIDFDFGYDRAIRVTVVPEEPFEVTFFLRRLRPTSTVVASGSVDLPGVVVEPGPVDPGGHFQPVRIRGRGSNPGVMNGWVHLQLENTPRESHAIPIRVQTVEPDRAIPGACIVSPDARGRVSQRIELRTFDRDPVSLRVEPYLSGAVVISQPMPDPGGERIWFVDIEVSVDDLPGHHGRAWVEVLDHGNDEIFRFPVLWLRPS